MEKANPPNHQVTKLSVKLEFGHFVVDRQGLIFASARDQANRIYNFLINSQTGNILEQTNHHFEAIGGEWAGYIKENIERSYGITPTFHIPHFELS